MSNFMFSCHVLTGGVKFPSALSYFSCVHAHPMFVLLPPPPSSLYPFALFCHTVLERGSLFPDPVRLSLILPGEPDCGV
jgi:hypothetical protein